LVNSGTMSRGLAFRVVNIVVLRKMAIYDKPTRTLMRQMVNEMPIYALTQHTKPKRSSSAVMSAQLFLHQNVFLQLTGIWRSASSSYHIQWPDAVSVGSRLGSRTFSVTSEKSMALQMKKAPFPLALHML